MEIRKLLEDVKEDKLSIDEALKILSRLPFEDIDFAKIDHHRKIRQGMSEVVFVKVKLSSKF